MNPIDSDFSIVQDIDDKNLYALMSMRTGGLVRFERHDLVKIMSDCSKWLDAEDSQPQEKDGPSER